MNLKPLLLSLLGDDDTRLTLTLKANISMYINMYNDQPQLMQFIYLFIYIFVDQLLIFGMPFPWMLDV